MDFKAGHGTTNLWGYSRAIDLVQESCLKDSQSKAKILLVGENDCRNLLKTISKLGFKNNLNLEFTIGETSVTAMSRILLLFKTLFQTEIPKDEKILFFLEIYANGKIRKKTLDFVQNTGKEIEMEIVDNRSGIFDFSRLKFREKDDLISVLKFWRSANEFNFEKLWDQRLLHYFKRRYDARENVIDWDYHAKLLDIDQTRLSILSRKEYLHWRMTGNAFHVSRGGASSSLCDHAWNKTLATVDVLKEVRILS